MICLALLQPYPYAIVHCGKDIENRTWFFKYRGPIALLASKSTTQAYYESARAFICMETAPELAEHAHRLPSRADLQKGGVVAVANIVDVLMPTATPTRRWHMAGQYGYVLTDVRPTKFLPYKGQRGLFQVPDHLIEVL